MTASSFKVFAFDGLRGLDEAGVLTGESVVRIVPESNSAEDPVWTTRIVSSCMSEEGAVRFPLIVDRRILARVVVATQVHGTPTVVRTDEDTTVSLLEPVTLEVARNTRHTGGLYEAESDIDWRGLTTCVPRQTLGAGVQVALPRGTQLEVLEAAPGSSDWMLAGEQGGGAPEGGVPELKRGVPWFPVVLGVGLLALAGWIILGGSIGEGRS